MQYIRTLHALLKPPSTRAGLHLTRTRISLSITKFAANMREVDGNRVAYANVSLPIIAGITYSFEA